MSNIEQIILGILLDKEQSGRDTREKLAKYGETISPPAFYQLMSRLEDQNFIESWDQDKVVKGHQIKERRYRITYKGTCAWKDSQMKHP